MSIKPNFVTYREKIKIFLYSGSFVTGKIYFSPLDIQWDCGTSYVDSKVAHKDVEDKTCVLNIMNKIFFNLSYLELTYTRKLRINYDYFIMKLTNTK